MNQTKLLYRLIQSLNKAEKKHFTQQVEKLQVKKDKYFYVLYKILESQSKFNETEIVETFIRKTQKKTLIDDKNYLQEHLLQSLATINTENNVELDIIQSIYIIRVLENKGQIELALKCLKQTIKKCEECEQVVLWLRCLQIEQSFYPYMHSNIDKTIEAHQTLTQVLESLQRINLLDTIVLKISKMYENDNKKSTSQYKSEIKNVLKQVPDINSLKLNRELASYHHIHFAVYYKAQEYTNSYTHIIKAMHYMKRNMHFIYEDKWMYVTGLINAAHNAYKIGLNSAIDEHFESINELLKDPNIKKNKLFVEEINKLFITHQLILYLFQKQYNKIISLEKDACTIFQSNDVDTYFTRPNNMNICFGIAHVASKNYDQAYSWALEETQQTNSRTNEIHTLICYFIKLIYYIEKENLDLFDNEYLSASRYIRKNKINTERNRSILKILDKCKNKNMKYDNAKSIENDIKKIEDIKEDYLYHFIFQWMKIN